MNKLLEKNPEDRATLKLKGDTHFEEGNIFDSEECYIKYLQSGEFEHKILQRLGKVYIERRAWDDAKTVFMKCVTEKNDWLSLARSCMSRDDLLETEDALMQANIMDT